MKKTLFISMIAAALTGSQVFAEEFIPTSTNATLVWGSIYAGAYSDTEDVTGANVTINEDRVHGDDFSAKQIYGGRTNGSDKTATNNSVTILGGQVYYVESGFSMHGDATNNSVTISGGRADEVYGGYTMGGSATDNTASASGGLIVDLVGGAAAGGGEASNNTVTVSDGLIGVVYGGSSENGIVEGNTVTISDGQIASAVYGGYGTNDGDARSNTVTISDGQVGEYVQGGFSVNGDVTNNTVSVSGGKLDGALIGGYGMNGNVSYNTAYVSGGQLSSVFGGFSFFGTSSGNTVVLSGGMVTGQVIAGASGGEGGVSDNHVYLVGKGASATIGDKEYTGGEITVVGGVSASETKSDTAPCTNNSIEIYGTGITAASLGSMQMLNFHIADGVLLSQEGMVSLTSTSDGDGLDLTGVELGFNGDAVEDWSAFDDPITLVTAAQSITIDAGSLGDVEIKDADGTTVATATLTLGGEDDTILYLTIDGGSTGPDALDVTLVNSLWASSAYVGEFVRLSEAQGYGLKAGDTAMWGGGFGTFMHVTGDKGFKSNGGGYGIGVNHAFSDNTQGGLSFGQGFGSYHNSGADGATVHQRAILAAATASTRIAKDFSLTGHLAYGSVRNRADCRLEGGSERARWNDNVFNLGARAAYDFHASDATAITPFLGLDWMYGAQESINGAYARHYSHGRLNELRLPVGVTVSTSAEVGSTKLLPQLSVAYVPAIAQQNPHANVSTDGADYRVKGYAPGRNAFMLNVGMNAIFSGNWSAGASYMLETRRHAVDQSVNASVRYTF